jgi:hypothetical protein
MVYGHFHEKSFTEVSYHELVCLDFKGNELGWFCLLKRKTFDSCPIFGRVLYNPSPTTFATMVLWVARKNGFSILLVCVRVQTHARLCEVATKERVQNDTYNFLKVWDLEGCGHTCGFINFLGVLTYIAFLWTFGCFTSNLNRGYIKCT